MDIISTSIRTDLMLGILEFIVLAIFFIKTKEYSVFELSYYYYLLAAPCFGLMNLFMIIIDPKTNIDPTHVDSILPDNFQLSISRRSELSKLFQLLFASQLIILPTWIELLAGGLSIVVRSSLTTSVSMNDLYIINLTPAILIVIPVCPIEIQRNLKEIRDCFPSNTIEDNHKSFIFTCIILDASILIVCIALNALVLIIGSLISANICNIELI